ncbi:hypothetical protein OIU84_016033 [Salix udensis]|uniref:RRM domain-containing protein n=1 Tax=Salix udensis TaxID=889485 RepID=A0AAD6J8S7_9ROSI|nr:hypothetical protein OIU84_016033 [Salix udensis]
MSFGQCSNSGIFQHRIHDDLKASGRCHITVQQDLLLSIWKMKEMLRMLSVGLDQSEFGRKGRRLRVEWTKQERESRRSPGSRRSSTNLMPSKTLFVINFDPVHTRTRDLERHFDTYGKILSTRIRRNFAFVQYELQEDATRALEATNMSKFMDRVISVEYAARDDERRNGHSPERRGHDRSPDRNYNRERSPSPYRRDRVSPDYGHGSNTNSRPEPRRNHNYDKAESPENKRYRSRSPPSRERSRS